MFKIFYYSHITSKTCMVFIDLNEKKKKIKSKYEIKQKTIKIKKIKYFIVMLKEISRSFTFIYNILKALHKR